MNPSDTAPETLTKKQRRHQLRALIAQQEETQAAIRKLEVPKNPEKKAKDSKTETPAPQTVPTKPGPSGVNVETSRLVRSIGAVILAGGIIALLVWQFGGAELLQLILYVALPLLAIFAALKLISYGTLQLIWNSDMDARVNAYMKSLKGDPTPA